MIVTGMRSWLLRAQARNRRLWLVTVTAIPGAIKIVGLAAAYAGAVARQYRLAWRGDA